MDVSHSSSIYCYISQYCYSLPADMAHLTSAISTLTALRSSLSSSSPTSPIIDLPSNLYHTAYARFFSHEKLADYPPHVENSCKASVSLSTWFRISPYRRHNDPRRQSYPFLVCHQLTPNHPQRPLLPQD